MVDDPLMALPDSNPRRWREYWKAQKLAQIATKNFGNPQQFWDNKRTVQQVYFKDSPELRQRTADRLEALAVPDGSRVLDIGCGAGVLAVPLAAKGCQVTVIEPSSVMREALSRHMEDEGVSGIRVVPERWEDVDPAGLGERFDVVIASFSLTMVDIGEAIEKMQQVSRGWVHLYWFLTSASWVGVVRDLWPAIHGVPFRGETTADCLWQVLYEMGIYANLHVDTPFPPNRFATVDDAVEEFYQRLNCTSPEQREIVQTYLQGRLRPSDEGYLLGGTTCAAHIWWNVTAGD